MTINAYPGAPATPQPFGVYGDPYTAPFVDGGTYMPAASTEFYYPVYTWSLPEFSEPYAVLEIYEGTPGDAILIDANLDTYPNTVVETQDYLSYGTLAFGKYLVPGTPVMGQQFFAVAYGVGSEGDITSAETYFETGVGSAPADLNVVHWTWGPTTGPMVAVNPIEGNDVISSSEAQNPLTITGTSRGVVGETVTVGLDGVQYTSAIASDGTWSVTVPEVAILPLHGTFTVTADVTDQFGQAAPEATQNLTFGDLSVVASSEGPDTPVTGTFISGGYLYVADGIVGFQTFQVDNPNSPQLVSTYADNPYNNNFTDVAVVGNLAYVVDDYYGLKILNVANPSSPSLVGSFAVTGSSSSVAVAGDYAYITDFNNHAVRVLDVSDPADPILVGSFVTPGDVIYDNQPNGFPYALAVSGNYLYIGDQIGAIYAVDVSNPATPSLVGSYGPFNEIQGVQPGMPVGPSDLVVSGKYLYVADEGNGFYILDVSNPASPSLVGAYNGGAGGNAEYTGVHVDGTVAFVTDASGKLTELDVSNPASPTLIASYVVGSEASAVSVAGNYAYVAASSVAPYVGDPDYSLVIANVSDALNHSRPSPVISSIAALPNSGEVGPGGIVTLTVNFDNAVTVASGTPILALNDGGTATYQSGSGTSALLFTYTVGAFGSGQNTPDLALAATNAFQLNGATITDGAGTAADLSAANGYNPGGILRIDTTDPIVTGVTAIVPSGSLDVGSGTHVSITITLDEAVRLKGKAPTLTLNDGGSATYDAGASKLSTGELVFDYTVKVGQNTDDLQVSNVNIPTGASINDASGHSADFSNAPMFMTGLQVDTTPVALPAAASIEMGGSIATDATRGVLVGDSDPNGYPLRVSSVDGSNSDVGTRISGTYGFLTLKANGSYNYVETSTAVPSTGAQDIFNFTVSDGHGGMASGSLDISIIAAPAGTLAYYVESAEAMLNAQILAKTVKNLDHLTNDSSLVQNIAEAVNPSGFGDTYSINAGFINIVSPPEPPDDLNQCAILVQALVPSVGGTSTWSNNQQVELNGAENPALAGPSAIGLPIATFEDATNEYRNVLPTMQGHYPADGSEHAAIFLGYGTEEGQAGFFILDQYDTNLKAPNPTVNTHTYEPAEVRFIGFSSIPRRQRTIQLFLKLL